MPHLFPKEDFLREKFTLKLLFFGFFFFFFFLGGGDKHVYIHITMRLRILGGGEPVRTPGVQGVYKKVGILCVHTK